MPAERRYLNLNAYLRNSGYHEAAWRVSPADPASLLDPRYYIGLARTAGRGVLDSIFRPDSPGISAGVAFRQNLRGQAARKTSFGAPTYQLAAGEPAPPCATTSAGPGRPRRPGAGPA